MLNFHYSTLILLSLHSSSVLAANDWSKPCFNGTCSYDLPEDPSGPSGTLKIWGSNTAIADITTAGGWEIIGCDPNKQEQDIRIVCKGIDIDGDGDNDGCSHLFADGPSTTSTVTSLPVPTGTVIDIGDNSTFANEDQRAIGKIVRLPEGCGKQAFARIANTWTHDNQTVPSHISKRLAPVHRRTQNRHKVKGLTIDTQFHKSNSAQHGVVNFAIAGDNVPGTKLSDHSEHSGKKRNIIRSRMFTQRRGFGDLVHNVGDAIGDGAGAVGGAIGDGAGAVGHAIGKGAEAVGGAVSDGVGAVKGAITGEKHLSNSVSAPISISKTFTLFEKSVKCSAKIGGGGNGKLSNSTIGVNGHLKVAVEAGVHGNIKLAVVASGSLTDLRIDSFGLTTTLDADLDGAIIMSAGVGGSIDSGKIKFFEVGVPGFDFPGIFSIGPTFEINGQAKVTLNIDTDMRIGVVYHISDLEFDFPNGGKKKGSFSAGDTPLQLSAQPSADATGKVEAHLIPSLNVGINAFEGVAKAQVFVNLDASASMTLKVDATLPSVHANVTTREVRSGVRGRGAIGAYYLRKRSPEPFGFGDIVSGIKDGAKKAAGAVKSGAGAVESGAKKAAGAVQSGAKKTASAVSSGAKAVEGGAKKTIEKGATKVESGAKKVGGTIEKGAKKVGGAVEEGAKKVEAGAKTAGQAIKGGAKEVGGAIAAGAKEDPPKSSSSVAPKASKQTVSVVVNDGVKFGGCLEMDAGLVASVGTDAKFFGLLNPSKPVRLFEKKFSLFQRCFGDAERRRSMGDPRAVLVGRGLECNRRNVGRVETLANGVVSAARVG